MEIRKDVQKLKKEQVLIQSSSNYEMLIKSII